MAKKKAKIPKTLAGWPVPRRLRKSGIVSAILGHPQARTILAEILVAAAGAAATALNRHQPNGTHALHAGGSPPTAGNPAPSVTSELAKSAAGALGHLALDVVEQVLPRKEVKKLKGKKSKGEDRAERRTRDERPARHH